MACAYVPSDLAFMQGILGYIDCQAQTIGEQGYLALAAPGSVASYILTGFLTILVALFGYRMLFGRAPDLSDGILTLVKIGVVVALATGWTGYRTLFYDVALQGPAELASSVGGASGLPGARGGMVQHLDLVDQQFQALAVAGAGGRPFGNEPPPLFAGFDTFGLGASRVAFLIGAVGAFAATRLLAGLLLALGPLFIAFLLFHSTRGLFEGWLRVLAGAALGSLAVMIALGVELALLEPWLADLVARRAVDQSIPGAPAQLLAVSLVFDVVLLAMIAGAARVAWALRMEVRWPSRLERGRSVARAEEGTAVLPTARRVLPVDGRSRAAAVADSLAAAERRETVYSAAAAGAAGAPISTSRVLPGAVVAEQSSPSDGAVARRTGRRVSASAGRRDAAR